MPLPPFLLMLLACGVPQLPTLQDTPAPTPFLSVRLVRPDEQLARFLTHFEGSKAASPASALAAWKRSKPGRGLSKTAEAGIAALNPDMIGELRALDGATLNLGYREKSKLAWRAGLPHDEGTFEALATALALTGGARLDPLNGQPVDRLGPAGAPLMSRGKEGKGVVLASSLADLTKARRQEPTPDPAFAGSIHSGLAATLEPSGFPAEGSLWILRASAALNGSGCERLELVSSLEGDSLKISVAGRFATPPALGTPRIDPDWFEAIPSERLLAAWGMAIDPTPAFWNSTFAWLDRVEKADSIRAGVAPLRPRLALVAAGVKLRHETELLPFLKGITVFIVQDDAKPIGSGLIRFYFDTPEHAKRFAEVILPRTAKALGQDRLELSPEGAQVWAFGGELGTIEVQADANSVAIGWGGEAVRLSRRAKLDPARSIAATLRSDAAASAGIQRFALIRPDPFLDVVGNNSTILWVGTGLGLNTRDEVRWSGLKSLVRRKLEKLLPETTPPGTLR